MTAEARCQPHEKKYFHTFPTIFLLQKWLPIHWDNSKRCFSSVFQSLYVLVLVDLYPAKEWSESVFLSVFFKAIATLPPWAALIFWPQPFLNYAHSSFWQWLVDIFPRLRWYISSASLIYFLGAQNLASLQMFGWAQPSISTKGYFSDLILNIYEKDLLDMPILPWHHDGNNISFEDPLDSNAVSKMISKHTCSFR